MSLEPLLSVALERANAALRQSRFDHIWIGGLARNVWGTSRPTTDLDVQVVVTPQQLEILCRELEAHGFLPSRRMPDPDLSEPLPNMLVLRSGTPDGVRLDMLVAKTPFERQAVGRRVQVDTFGVTAAIASVEDFVIYKLLAFRSRDQGDIEDVLRTRQLEGVAIDIAHIDRWAEEWDVTGRWLPYRQQFAP